MPRQPSPVRPRRADERQYLAALRRLLDPSLSRLLSRLSEAVSYVDALRILDTTNIAEMPEVIPLVREQLNSIAAYHRWRTVAVFSRALGVDIRPVLADAAVRPFVEERIRQNVALVRTIEPRYHESLWRDIIRLQAKAPFDRAALSRVLARDYRSAGYNLRRLTRDQNNKMVGQLTEVRQRQLGVREYTWRTSEDERVRDTHAAKNGKRFQWGEPPSDTGHPGYDIQCRCVAQAILPAAAHPLSG